MEELETQGTITEKLVLLSFDEEFKKLNPPQSVQEETPVEE
jgi:hypothetical protein